MLLQQGFSVVCLLPQWAFGGKVLTLSSIISIAWLREWWGWWKCTFVTLMLHILHNIPVVSLLFCWGLELTQAEICIINFFTYIITHLKVTCKCKHHGNVCSGNYDNFANSYFIFSWKLTAVQGWYSLVDNGLHKSTWIIYYFNWYLRLFLIQSVDTLRRMHIRNSGVYVCVCVYLLT